MINQTQVLRKKWIAANVIFASLILTISCNITEVRTNNLPNDANAHTIAPAPHSQIPQGNEIDVSLECNGRRSATVVVKNVSSKEVYLEYLPGISDESAEFLSLGLERKNSANGVFEVAERAHLSPGLNPLSPGKSFSYGFTVETEDEYRLNVRYLVDKNWSERRNSMPFLDREERIKIAREFDDQIGNIVGSVTVGPFCL